MSWFFKRAADTPDEPPRVASFETIEDDRRDIFEYWDGRKKRRIDPMQALFSLEGHPEYNADVHAPLVDAGDPEATRITVAAVCQAFDVQEFDEATGAGLVITELLELYCTFCVYLDELKKSIEPPPTLQLPMAQTSSESGEQTTNAM